jgi:hypothetical protein
MKKVYIKLNEREQWPEGTTPFGPDRYDKSQSTQRSPDKKTKEHDHEGKSEKRKDRQEVLERPDELPRFHTHARPVRKKGNPE